MASGGFDIAKAGWLYRQSSVLRRWKKSWFVLDRQGDLRYFETPDTPRAEERLVVRAVVTHIKTGPDCRPANPPEGVSSAKACFLELSLREGYSLLLCAESFDDMRAWQIAIEDARTMLARGPPPSVMSTTTIVGAPGYIHSNSPYMGYGYPGQVISTTPMMGAPPAQVIHSPAGTTTVVQAPPQQIVYVDDNPYRYRRRYCRGGFYPTPLFFW
ncbi:pleckstrin homology domain-containing family B member 2 [Aplysia californica]|uniref:Pleckstrin homology domain-containing family B member 2 n=1 Tax=Aplysia californica TaxID=6500 RepID=A0ABM0JLC1_APLCA|nr:pleckstrin homology domain-containing family B member 2 [Aplysia californica]